MRTRRRPARWSGISPRCSTRWWRSRWRTARARSPIIRARRSVSTADRCSPAIRRTSLSLASPASTQSSQNHKGNYSFYAVADQMVWRRSADSPQSVNAFARIMGAPGDPNLVDVCMNAGVPLMAPFRGRDDDVVGLAPRLREDRGARTGPRQRYGVVHHALTPVAQCGDGDRGDLPVSGTPWWLLQADSLYLFRPSGAFRT